MCLIFFDFKIEQVLIIEYIVLKIFNLKKILIYLGLELITIDAVYVEQQFMMINNWRYKSLNIKKNSTAVIKI
jgi:hypothetical protein